MTEPARQSLRALDYLNFFLADVRGAALSNLVAGYDVKAWDFDAEFLALAAIAGLAFMV